MNCRASIEHLVEEERRKSVFGRAKKMLAEGSPCKHFLRI
jgi:hypothetical protein